MATLSEQSQWEEGIYQLEKEDLVDGGTDGIDNVQAKQLANRTKYLKGLVENLSTGKQPLDATLTAIAALVGAADRMIYFTGNDAAALATITAFGRSLLDDGDAATARATLGAASPADIAAAIAALVNSSPAALDTLNELATALGNDANFSTTMMNALAGKQPIDATLTAIADLVGAADRMIYFTGNDAAALATITAFGRSLLDDGDAATARATLGAASLTDIGSGKIIASLFTATRAVMAASGDTTVMTLNFTLTQAIPVVVDWRAWFGAYTALQVVGDARVMLGAVQKSRSSRIHLGSYSSGYSFTFPFVGSTYLGTLPAGSYVVSVVWNNQTPSSGVFNPGPVDASGQWSQADSEIIVRAAY